MTKTPIEQIILSQRDWEWFVQILDDESPPNTKLQEAALKYKVGLLPIFAGRKGKADFAQFRSILLRKGSLLPREGDTVDEKWGI